MIWEIWQYLATTPKIAQAKEMGYLKESIAMAARANRCKAEWGAHYEFCKNGILEAADRALKIRKVLIFGAGSLQDIPLAELSDRFDKVLLVDLVFLKSARKAVKKYANIELIEHDVTESLSWISSGQAMAQNPTKWLDDQELDLVVSLNLITQLPLIPVRWLMAQCQFTEEQADILGKQLIFAHLHYLRQFPGEVCLIADRQGVEFDRQGVEIDRYDPWWDIEPPAPNYFWEWEVIPIGEGLQGRWQKNKVGISFL